MAVAPHEAVGGWEFLTNLLFGAGIWGSDRRGAATAQP